MSSEHQNDGRSVAEVYDSLTNEQKALVEYLVAQAAALNPQELASFGAELDQFEQALASSAQGEAGEEAPLAQARQELIDLINKLAVVRGKVTLSSGKEADYYIDLRRVTLHHRGAPLIGVLMLEHLAKNGLMADAEFSAIGGLTLGADPIATAVMHAAAMFGHQIDAFVVRKAAKAHGMQRQIEGPDIEGRNVIIVEDTTTTGSSPIAAIEAAREAGANPIAVATIVDRDTGANEKIEALGVPYLPMFTLSDLTI